MKKYYPYILAGVAIILIGGAIFVFQNGARNNSQTKPAQKQESVRQPLPAPKQESHKGGLQVSSPCEGVSMPVCGEDGKTYASECLAKFLGVKIASQGMCPRQIIQ